MKSTFPRLLLLCCFLSTYATSILNAQMGAAENPSEETRLILLHINSHISYGENAVMVPNMPCEVGLGYESVASGGFGWNSPLQGMVTLTQGKTDGDGDWELALEVPTAFLETAQQTHAAIWIRPLALGYQQRVWMHGLLDANTKELDLELRLWRGSTLRGQVLLPDGSPAKQAQLTFITQKDDGKELKSRSPVKTDEEGRFQIHTYATESQCHLLAELSGAGNATLMNVPLDILHPQQNLNIMLHGDGVLSGRILDLDGKPMRRYSLSAEPVDAEAYGNGFLNSSRSFTLALLQRKGLWGDRTITDDEGYFRFKGLHEGEYDIRGFSPKGGNLNYLTKVSVWTGDENVSLQSTQYRIAVKVLDHLGNSVHPLPKFEPWAQQVPNALYLKKCSADGIIEMYPENDWHVPQWSPRGETIFTVLPDVTYALGVVSAREPLHEEILFIRPGQYETLHTIQLAPPAAPGHLKVLIQSEKGESIPSYMRHSISSLKTGLILRGGGRLLDQQAGFDTPMAAGDYLLKADGEMDFPSYGRTFLDWSPAQKVIHVEAGTTTNTSLSLPGGGRFRVSVRTIGKAGVPKDFEMWSLDTSNNNAALYHDGVHFRLTSLETGETIEPTFLLPLPSFMTHHYDYGDWVQNGDSGWAYDLLTPGKYLLRAQMDGYPIEEEVIQIAYGETTVVHMILKAKG